MKELTRRPFLTEPGESLLLCRAAVRAASRFREFREASGLPAEAVLTSTLAAVPFPIYPKDPAQRWTGVRPEFMWHPLMWLPERLAGRYQVRGPETGDLDLEDDDTWSVRLVFELLASGLYDIESGTWIDILATVGLDIDNEVDQARVADWLAGEPDELLDSISLENYFASDDEQWAYDSAAGLLGSLRGASHALIADDLLDVVDATSGGADMPHDKTLLVLRSVAGLAESFLHDVPDPDGERSYASLFASLHDGVDIEARQPVEFVARDELDQLTSQLTTIRDLYWPHLEELAGRTGSAHLATDNHPGPLLATP
ncbi:MAG: hypothetical protein ACRCYU_12040 [Nocardioides sp.]